MGGPSPPLTWLSPNFIPTQRTIKRRLYKYRRLHEICGERPWGSHPHVIRCPSSYANQLIAKLIITLFRSEHHSYNLTN